MPLPTDPRALALGKDLVQAFDNVNGLHPGYRPAHAKGIMFSGVFAPSREASSLTRALHAQQASTPITVRFSDFAGIPSVADNDAEHASPRGIAIRFHLSERAHTDIIGHSIDGFPVRTAEEFLALLQALQSSGPAAPKPTPIESFLAAHPKALQFIQTPKPIPSSFARESFYSVNALKFTNREGASRFGRYRILPEAGNDPLDAAAAAAKGPNFLFDEIAARVAAGPVKFHIRVQAAAAGDVVDDATISWPSDRPQIPFGTVTVTQRVANDADEQRQIIFDPIPRTDGIDPSNDPLLEPRATVYLLSGRRRRAAGAQ
ncbi:MAG TPA: catalase family peroxidase [Candidatus Binatia bacterium]|nr:catalase family peroxidase [Candidatus Binatia bacterium]